MNKVYSAAVADESPRFHNRHMSHLLIFGPGYTATRLADRQLAKGWTVTKIRRDDPQNAIMPRIASATHILSSVPPDGEGDPILERFGESIARSGARWVGYLSSTGVYGDSAGAWVDEFTAISGRRGARNAADQAWAALHPEARVFRLPGIYGPGRSALDRVREGRAHRLEMADQIFSRVHVDDIISGMAASIDRGPPGIYNLADDLPAPQNDVIVFAAQLSGCPLPPLLSLEAAALSPQARAFYAENRRVANGKAKRLLGWRPRYPTFREGLAALSRDGA